MIRGSNEGFGSLVWAPDPKEGFFLGRVRDIRAENMVIESLDGLHTIMAEYDNIFPADEDRIKDVDDNCALLCLNEGTLLENCRRRYARKQIYTYVANILISINPYEQIPDLYGADAIRKYQGKSLGTMAPHIFAIADNAYRDMKRIGSSQSVIVSGESGAGKTESQKYILRYLCESWGRTAGPVEQRILETNPILEAFGNAKTLRNNNSSRFGKFIEIHFGSQYSVAGGFVSHYLLEKSRICRQQSGERNYHIFYQLIAGATPDEASRLSLASPAHFNYLNGGCTSLFTTKLSSKSVHPTRRDPKVKDLYDELLDDYSDLQKLRNALRSVGLSEKDCFSIFSIIAALLHLGNVSFVDNVDDSRGGCMINHASLNSFKIASKLLGVEEFELHQGLISRVMQPTRGGIKGTLIRVPLKPHEAIAARDALAKAIYSRLFDTIVAAINRCIPFGDSNAYIGVLDIAGFEFFAVNSFEQFCINYCNEKLQHFFNERILKLEQELYKKEGLNVPRIEYSDNEDCIELFEHRVSGLLDMLDEEARLPRPSVQHFTSLAHKTLKDHFRFLVPRKSKLREHRDMRDDEGFIIRHFAGSVCYQTSLFLDKNNDALHMSLEILMEESSNEFIRNLFEPKENLKNGPSSGKAMTNKLKIASVSSKFRAQLAILLEKLKCTNTHFVRCIKPNSEMKSGKFEGAEILSQLKCAGMTSVLKLMQKGYPSRTMFADLYRTYERILPSQLARLDPRLFCKCLFHALGLNDSDFKFGQTKVFFKPGKFAEFDQMLRKDPDNMRMLIKKVQSWLHHVRWKKVQYGVWSCIKLQRKISYRIEAYTKIQTGIRGYLVRKHYRPRISCYRKIRLLSSQLTELRKIIDRLSQSSREKWSLTLNEYEDQVEKLIKYLKDEHCRINVAEDHYNNLNLKISTMYQALKGQLALEEKERMRQLEMQLEREKEAERIAKQKKETQERQKAERQQLEEARQLEANEALMNQQLIEEQIKIEQQLQLERRKHEEQERLDAELVKRLVQEDARLHVVENVPSTNGIQKTDDRHHLSNWKYADLRDVINTSTDIDLLKACKEEFHRRMRIYQQWKDRNRTNPNQKTTRAPASVLPSNSYVSNSKYVATKSSTNIQRYFKVPFTSPSERSKLSPEHLLDDKHSQGLWYAHFDGQWIARQMEIHPNRRPVLLITGQDDMNMCELSLNETQLTKKKGAEILADEFELLWSYYGGQKYSSRPNALS